MARWVGARWQKLHLSYFLFPKNETEPVDTPLYPCIPYCFLEILWVLRVLFGVLLLADLLSLLPRRSAGSLSARASALSSSACCGSCQSSQLDRCRAGAPSRPRKAMATSKTDTPLFRPLCHRGSLLSSTWRSSGTWRPQVTDPSCSAIRSWCPNHRRRCDSSICFPMFVFNVMSRRTRSYLM